MMKWFSPLQIAAKTGVLSLMAATGLVVPLSAQAGLTVTPLTWNIIGLDSNSPATGPRHFPVGARICADALGSNGTITSSLVWDNANANINVRPGSDSTLSFAALAANACVDAYYEVEVTAVPAAFDTTRRYRITAGDGNGTVSSPAPRELYVEHLVSQSRNAITNVRYGPNPSSLVAVAPGGNMSLVVGNTYTIELSGGTATQGYEQFEAFINFTNTIFQILDVSTTYSADTTTHVDSPNDKLYGDACFWQNDPNSPAYRSCRDVGKIGGSNVVSTYTIRIVGGGGTSQTLNTLLYDFSGSSYHYNADFGLGGRIADIIDPTTATIAKSFTPSTIPVGGVSTLKLTLSNPNAGALSGYNFVDNLPANMMVATPATFSTSGCGTPTFAPTAGATTLNFSNGTVAGNSTCTISVGVTTTTTGSFTNTTNHLFIDTTDTGDDASAILTVNNAPPPPACTPNLTMASWAFGNTTLPPPFTFKAANVATAAASFAERGGNTPNAIDTANGQPANSWSGTGWNRSSDPVPTATTTSYFEFTVATANYSSQPVSIAFQANPISGWANPSDNEIYVFASVDGGAFSTVFSSTTIQRNSWNTIPASAAPSAGSSSTVFRVIGRGRSNGSPNAPLLLDNVVISGCGVPDHPTLTKAFSPNPIAAGATSTLTFTLNNTSSVALTGATFSDALPAGMSVSTNGFVANTCGFSATAPTVGATSLAFSGGTIPANGTCSVAVNVTSSVPGPSTNISGFISTTQTGENSGPGGSAVATLTVISPPLIDKVFAPNPILPGGVTTLTFNITNPNVSNAISGVAFSDTFPTSPGAMVVANPPNASTSGCGAPTFAPAIGASSVSFSGGTIAAGAICTVRVNVTAPLAGSYANTTGPVSHIVNGTPVNGNTGSDTLTVNPPVPGIALLKEVGASATGPWASYLTVQLPASVWYRFTIENTGNAVLNSLALNDPMLGGAVSCTPALPASLPVADILDNDHIFTCVAGPFAATPGTITNTATASGNGGSPVSDTDSATYANIALAFDKSASPLVYNNAGEVITYTFLVTNTGNAVIDGPITVLDDRTTNETCPALTTIGDLDNFLDPGESLTCTATYTITAGDVSAGSVVNIAHATNGTIDSPTDTATVTTPLPIADLTLTKTDSPDPVAVGGALTYTLTVGNLGSDPFPSSATLTIREVMPAGLSGCSYTPSAGTFNVGTIAPSTTGSGTWTGVAIPVGGSATLTIVCTVTNAVSSPITNTATVLPPTGILDPDCSGSPIDCIGDNTDSEDTAVIRPQLTLTKTASPATFTVGVPASYTITVTNTGTAPTSATATISDTIPAGLSIGTLPSGCSAVLQALTCTIPAPLAAGNSVAFVIPVTPTASAANGNNTATVSGGGDPTCPATARCGDTVVVPIVAPLLTTTKTGVLNNAVVPPNDQSNPGDTIAYTITVVNSGTGAATNVVVADPRLPGLSCTPASGSTLAAGATMTCTGTYTLVAGDISTGSVSNTATVTGGNVCNPTTAGSTCSDTEVTPLGLVPILTTTKTGALNNAVVAPNDQSNPGDTIAYTITVVNSGNGPATNVAVSDPRLPGLVCTPASGSTLAAGATMTCTGTYTLVAGDITTGSVSNTATVTGGNVCNPTTAGSTCSDTEVTPLNVFPLLTTTKTGVLNNAVVAPNDQSNPGDTIAYTITVVNSGNGAATNVTVTDPLLPGLSCTPANGSTLAAGATMTCTGTYTLVAGDITTGSVSNTATVNGGNVCNPTTAGSTCSDTEVTPLNVFPLLTTTKTAVLNNAVVPPNDQSNVGDTIAYTITVVNSGNGAATNVTVADPLLPGLSCTPANGSTLAAGATMICTGTYTLVAGDISAGSVSNTATVTGGNVCNPTSAGSTCSDTRVTPLGQVPVLTTTKTGVLNNAVVAPNDQSNPGDTIAYTITVVNSGNAAATNVVVTDPLLPGLSCTPASGSTLPAGATMTCAGTHVLTTTDIGNGSVSNTATVSGGNVCNPTTLGSTCSDTEVTPLVLLPDLMLTKTHGGSFVLGQSGGSYTLTVSNVGPVASSGLVTVVDVLPTGLIATAISGSGWTCTLGTLTCTRSDALAAGGSYPAITLLVDVAANAPTTIVNFAGVSGGGDTNPTNNTDDDPVTVTNGTPEQPPVPVPVDARWALMLMVLAFLALAARQSRRSH